MALGGQQGETKNVLAAAGIRSGVPAGVPGKGQCHQPVKSKSAREKMPPASKKQIGGETAFL